MRPPRPCPSCAAPTSAVVFALPRGDRMRRCVACGSLFPEAPSTENAYDDYYTAQPRRGGWRATARRLADQTRRRYVDRALPASAHRVLDFGCGGGGYLERIAGPGRRGFGVDPFATPSAATGWTRLDVDQLDAAGAFDWITLGHVLEHLDNPEGALRRLAALLAPGAGLWIATPNAGGFLIEAAGALARDIDYPRHRQIFTREGLERLALRAGLALEFLPAPPINTLLNVAATLRLIAEDRSRRLPERLALLLKVLAALAWFLAALAGPGRRWSPELVAIGRPLQSGVSADA